jgi:quercetin dioxygenase-like cupin family protein
MTADDEPRSVEAADYAIGALSGVAYENARTRAATDADFAAEAGEIEKMLAPLTRVLAPLDVSDDLLDGIEDRIDALQKGIAHCAVVRANQGDWTQLKPGVRVKVLHAKPEIRRYTYLLELDAGAVADAHEHDRDDEECYVISGDIAFGDVLLGPGDFHLAPKGSHHGLVRSTNGCVCLIVAALEM